jgi:signal transduction histidine kinase
MSTLSTPLPASRWRPVIRRGAGIAGLGLAIAVMLTLVFRHDFWPTLLYSLSITTFCWLFIDGGRVLAARWVHRRQPECEAYGQWPGWPWMAGVVIAGTALGYTAGTALGNALTGFRSPGLAVDSVQQALAVLLFALIPGIATTYFFYSREKLASSEAQAQTAQRQAAENQLKLLESQLEPHMLFNTLANLRVLIGIDPPRAQAMLDRLIAFLRATLEASRNGSHPLASEFARIADYLALMKVRMGDRLETRLELPPDLAAHPVPPLLLQPLVENAIKHGIEPHVRGGRLAVSAAREGDALVLRVRDTGAGLSAVPADGTRFGLRQVRDRLATLHGEAASLQIAPAGDAEGGTLATVTLPIAEGRCACRLP